MVFKEFAGSDTVLVRPSRTMETLLGSSVWFARRTATLPSVFTNAIASS